MILCRIHQSINHVGYWCAPSSLHLFLLDICPTLLWGKSSTSIKPTLSAKEHRDLHAKNVMVDFPSRVLSPSPKKMWVEKEARWDHRSIGCLVPLQFLLVVFGLYLPPLLRCCLIVVFHLSSIGWSLRQIYHHLNQIRLQRIGRTAMLLCIGCELDVVFRSPMNPSIGQCLKKSV